MLQWYVLYVKPRQEKQVSKLLEKLGVEVFCPMVSEIRQWSDRKKKVEVPLFKSYVFVRLIEKERHIVFEVSGIVRYLFWLGSPAIVRDEEIQTIRKWLEDELIEGLEISNLTPGKEIIIKKGPFKNRKAIVKEVGSKRLSLILKQLGVVVTAKTKEII